MKTKLLRKIRRKYEVLEVVKPKDLYDRKMYDKGLRFKVNVYYVFNEYYATRQDAIDGILHWVRVNWYDKIKGSKSEYRKVWYNKNV